MKNQVLRCDKNSTAFFHHFCIHSLSLFLFSFILSVFCSIPAYSVHKTYMWPSGPDDDHMGYSIELIPGTGENGIPAEYVAAGTVGGGAWFPANTYKWHFMRLDDNGTIMQERISEANDPNIELRVVDIAAESNTKFWITIQVRDKTPGAEKDYVYVAGVDDNGLSLPMNPNVAINNNSAFSTYENIYATHSLFSNGSLYICGYAGENTQYPNAPDKVSSKKIGMMLKVDLSVSPALPSIYTWNTGGDPTIDFDMPLRIAPSSAGNDFPLLVTGAANTYAREISGVLVMEFDQNIRLLKQNVVSGQYLPNDPNDIKGDYGVDIRKMGVDGYNPDYDYVVLVNYYEQQNINDKTWGIIRLQNNFSTYPTGSYLKLNDRKSWAKQFNELELASDGIEQYVTVVGEQIDIYDPGCLNYGGNRPPATYNVNPFFANIPVNDAQHNPFDFTTGFDAGYISSVWTPNTVHFSARGTGALSMQYIKQQNALYDVTRLYTFCSRRDYYFENFDPQLPLPNQEPALITGYGDNVISGSVHALYDDILRQKFIKTNSAYEELDCQQYDEDCPELVAEDAGNVAAIGSEQYSVYTSNILFNVSTLYNQMPPEFDCSSGYYKTAGIEEVNSNKDVTIYPNPANDKLHLTIPGNKGVDYLFNISDIVGKLIFTSEGVIGNDNVIALPEVTPGVYVATVRYAGHTHTQKITIE